jgi:hypothetical protein
LILADSGTEPFENSGKWSTASELSPYDEGRTISKVSTFKIWAVQQFAHVKINCLGQILLKPCHQANQRL